jgi:hypothetical protein
MNTQILQEARTLITYGIENGWIKPSQNHVTEQELKKLKEADRYEKRKAQQQARREQNHALGLTKDGKPRKRAVREDLSGWTDDQKHTRQLQQQKAWNQANRDWRSLP